MPLIIGVGNARYELLMVNTAFMVGVPSNFPTVFPLDPAWRMILYICTEPFFPNGIQVMPLRPSFAYFRDS